MNLFPLLGVLLAAAGCTAFYLASPHQQWLAAAWPGLPARGLGLGLWLCSAWALACGLMSLTAVLVFVTTLMATCVLLPYVGALKFLIRRRP